MFALAADNHQVILTVASDMPLFFIQKLSLTFIENVVILFAIICSRRHRQISILNGTRSSFNILDIRQLVFTLSLKVFEVDVW